MSATTRVQLTHTVGLHISPARVRRFIDKRGMNRVVEDEIHAEKDQILAIEKEGTTAVAEFTLVKPTAVDGQEPTAAALESYNAALAAHQAAQAVYKNYKSERYNTLNNVYKLASELTKLSHLLQKQNAVAAAGANDKKKFTQKNIDEMNRVVTRLNTEFTSGVAGVTLTSLDSVTAALASLNTKYPDLVHFFNRDASSARRVRFNDRATVALATVMECIVEQLTEHSMNHVIELGKKIIQPDHCVSPGLENCPLYPLFSTLPAMQALRSRQERHAAYDARTKKEQADANQKAKAEARKRQKTFKAVKLVQPTFAETEVDGGYAVRVEADATERDENGEATQKYAWYGIDVPANEADTVDTTDFVHYVDLLTKNFKKIAVDDGNTAWADIRISGNIRNFFSNILIQFIARMLPLISLTISSKKSNVKKNDVKTVCDRTIMRVVEMLLADSNHNAQGLVKFSQEHTDLFNTVAAKLTLLETHLAAKAERKKLTGETADEDDDEEVPAPVVAAAPAPVATTAPVATPTPAAVETPAESARSRRTRKP